MDRERWDRVGALFDEVRAKSAADRDRVLDRACAGDDELRHEVVSLLAAHVAAGGDFLDELDTEGVADLVGSDGGIGEVAPSRIGPWRIVAEIGRGGMGVVYDAIRDDGQFEQGAALKLIKRGMDSDQIVERFVRERQIVARMEHPGIARLLDGGVTPEGQPWFALERVEGVPVTEYCDERRLPLEERLQIFCEVCSAVHYAHRNLVVHRDLKPSNILVDPGGRVKLLDFGIAKLLIAEDQISTDETRAGVSLVTPGYGAPEQVLGGAVTTATDVYALGVILYELLTGGRPHTFDAGSLPQQMAAVASGVPPRPLSRATSEAATDRAITLPKLRRKLAGDLGTITSKAIQGEPERRYASTEALREDIERYLSGQPVRARPDSLLYRTRMFLARHRVSVAAAGLGLSALVGGLGTALWQADVAAHERDIAREESDQADQVKKFLIDLFQGSDPNQPVPRDLTAQDLLDRGLERVRGDLADRPELKIELLTSVGEISTSLGDYAAAQSVLEEALAVEVRDEARDQLRVAQVLDHLGEVTLLAGDMDAAVDYDRRALELRRRWAEPGSLELAHSYNQLGVALASRADLDEAIEVYEEALKIYREADASSIDVLTTRYNLGMSLRKQGEWEEAARILRQVVVQAEQDFSDADIDRLGYLDGLGVVEGRLGRLVESAELLRRSVELAIEVRGEAHPDTRIRMNNHALALHALGRDREAEELMRKVLHYDAEQFGEEHRYVALSRTNLARILVERGEVEEALSEFDRAGKVHRVASPDSYLVSHLVRQALGWFAAGDLDKARRTIDEGLALHRESPDSEKLVASIATAAVVRSRLGLDPEARSLFEEALELHRGMGGSRHPDAGWVLVELAALDIRGGALDAARERLDDAIEILSSSLPTEHPRRAEANVVLGDCLVQEGRTEEGVDLVRGALSELERNLGAEHWRARAVRARLEAMSTGLLRTNL